MVNSTDIGSIFSTAGSTGIPVPDQTTYTDSVSTLVVDAAHRRSDRFSMIERLAGSRSGRCGGHRLRGKPVRLTVAGWMDLSRFAASLEESESSAFLNRDGCRLDSRLGPRTAEIEADTTTPGPLHTKDYS
jgi:hypothetical protein